MRKIFDNFEEILASMILFIMIVIAFANVVSRYFLSSAIAFTDELTSKLFVLFSLIGASIAVKRKAHLGLSIITDLFHPKLQRLVSVISNLLATLLFVIILIYGVKMTMYEFTVKQTTAGLQWPEWIFGIYIPIGSLVLSIRFGQSAWKAYKNKGLEI